MKTVIAKEQPDGSWTLSQQPRGGKEITYPGERYREVSDILAKLPGVMLVEIHLTGKYL